MTTLGGVLREYRVAEADVLELGVMPAIYLGGVGVDRARDGTWTLVGAYRNALWRYAYAVEMQRIIPILEQRLAGLEWLAEEWKDKG